MHPVHIFPPSSPKSHSNNLPIYTEVFRFVFFFQVLQQTFLCTSHVSQSCYMPPSCSSTFLNLSLLEGAQCLEDSSSWYLFNRFSFPYTRYTDLWSGRQQHPMKMFWKPRESKSLQSKLTLKSLQRSAWLNVTCWNISQNTHKRKQCEGSEFSAVTNIIMRMCTLCLLCMYIL